MIFINTIALAIAAFVSLTAAAGTAELTATEALTAAGAAKFSTAHITNKTDSYQTPMVHGLPLYPAPTTSLAVKARYVTGHFCNMDWALKETANYGRILEGIMYLDKLEPNILCTARSRSCSRISCSYNSAIYLCNDNFNDIAISCYTAAAYTMDILNICAPHDLNTPQNTVGVIGQEFDSASWNIIVHGMDRC